MPHFILSLSTPCIPITFYTHLRFVVLLSDCMIYIAFSSFFATVSFPPFCFLFLMLLNAVFQWFSICSPHSSLIICPLQKKFTSWTDTTLITDPYTSFIFISMCHNSYSALIHPFKSCQRYVHTYIYRYSLHMLDSN